MLTPIIWRTKFDSFLSQFYSYFMSMFLIVKFLISKSKRKNLKSSTISQNQSVFPIFKLMQASCLLNDFTPWTKIKMKGVRQNQVNRRNLLTNILGVLQKIQNQSLNRRFSPNRHKNWGFKSDAIERDFTDSGFSFLFENLELKFRHDMK